MSDPTRFGRYEVEEEVARGGMGVIYRVRDPEMRRFLALKVLRTEDGEVAGSAESGSRRSSITARFTDEAQLTGQLDHPGIIPVYDMGQGEDGRLYFTMRLVKGRTLEEVFSFVREGRENWSVTRALGVLQKVCEAMAFAHDRGVIHRDLKPANVMVGRFGETYVMDWGLAKLVDDASASPREESTQLQTVLTSARKDESNRGRGALETLDGDVMGTPAYMAPEQARGERHRIGPAADVYAVGAMLYHLLAGHPPYGAAGGGTPPAQVLPRLLGGPPDPVESIAASAPPELCAICERAMERDPERRYAGMLELAEDLQAYLENRVVQAYRRGAVVEFKKWVQRNRAIATSLAAIVVLVIAGLGAVSYVQTRARADVEKSNEQLAETNRQLEVERERTADALARAERNRELASASEVVARANETEALWQSYVGNVGAAYAALELGSASETRRRLAACPEDLRGWEWRYLNERADASLRVLNGSETFVMALAVDPMRAHVAAAGGMIGDSGTPDFAVRVWDYESGELEREFLGNEATVTGLVYSPAGDLLASSDERGTLHVWDAESGELVAAPKGLGGRIAFHPDGRLIASANVGPGKITLWDTWNLAAVGQQQLPIGTNALRFSPDGKSLALAGRDHHVRILDLELRTLLDLDASDQAPVVEPVEFGTGVVCLDYAPDGRHLVTGSSDRLVRIWDLESAARPRILRGHQANVLAVRWHPRLPWIVSSDATGAIRFWDADTGQPLDVLRGHDDKVPELAFSALGDRLFSASLDTTVRVWDGQAGANDTILGGLAFPNFRPYLLSFAPDGGRVVWTLDKEALAVTDVRTGEDQCSSWVADPFATRALRFTGAGVWEADSLGRLASWNAVTGEQLAAWDTGWGTTTAAFGRDGRVALVAGYAEGKPDASERPSLMAVDLATGDPLWSEELSFEPGLPISLSPDGTRCLLVAGTRTGDDYGIVCIDTASGELVWERWGLTDVPVHGMAFFPDGERFAHLTYNAWDYAVFVRDVATGEVLERLVGHAQPGSLDVSPDGSRIVTGNWDGSLSLWSPERGEVLVLPAHGASFISNVQFSPDGETIASLGQDGRRRLWSATSVETRQDARRAAAARRRWAVDARERVDALLSTRVHSQAVVEALEADPQLVPEQRAAAILLARSSASDLSGISSRALAIGVDRNRTGAEYVAALEGARLATARMPRLSVQLSRDMHDRVAVLHAAAALAQVRLGLPREALASLGLADQWRAGGSGAALAVVDLVGALAQHTLGDDEAARSAYRRGKSAVRDSDPNARALELEVRGLLESE